jgi:hypothetical protein
MPKSRSLDSILDDWPFEPGQLSARLLEVEPGREVLQMRIDMGVMQMEMSGRPDGTRPEGFETYFDYVMGEALRDGDDFTLTEEQCAEAEREFVQFYHRRICRLALKDYAGAQADAEHTLRFMDFCRDHAPDEDWALAREQYRPFVLFHHTQARALHVLEERDAEAAVQAINDGLESFRELFVRFDAEERFEEDELVVRLTAMREDMRSEFDVGRTLYERLEDAVAGEQYELAARLRDEISRREELGARRGAGRKA